MQWGGWPIERMVILFVSVAFLLVGVQVGMLHYRQNFRRKIMYVPVAASPVLFLLGLLSVFFRSDALFFVFAIVLALGALFGLVGLYLLVKGVGVRVGGYALRNFLVGPPVMMPLLFSALAILGLIALYWH